MQRPLAVTREEQFQSEWNELLLAELQAIRKLLETKEEPKDVAEGKRSTGRERKQPQG